jgi:ubiquinone/menaquinone biosynthesis C-methylase UbiE
VGVYAKYVLPHLIDLAMRNKDATRVRGDWVPQARGDVLEIGIGSGLNLPFYSSDVARVYGLEPSVALQDMARKRAAAGRIQLEFLSQSAEEALPLGDNRIDTIVMTWTLCSIPNAPRALAEMKRVLKADGRLLFVEHGRSPDTRVVAWQDRLTPVWKKIGGGCHLNRKIDQLLAMAGFSIGELKPRIFRDPG